MPLDLVRDLVGFLPGLGVPQIVLSGVHPPVIPNQLAVHFADLIQVVDQHLVLRPVQAGSLHPLDLVFPAGLVVQNRLVGVPAQAPPLVTNTYLLLTLSLSVLEDLVLDLDVHAPRVLVDLLALGGFPKDVVVHGLPSFLQAIADRDHHVRSVHSFAVVR